MPGKHIFKVQENEKLRETVRLKEKELKDVKFSIAEILQEIIDINESNDYSNSDSKKRKISELCEKTRYELLCDEEIDEKKNYLATSK